MIRARLGNGIFILGVDAENIKRLKQGEPIKVDLSDLGGSDTVVITYGNTMAEIQSELEVLFGPMPAAQPLGPKGEQ